ncbi:class I SAM-dependent methyltransferase [Saccharothrix longispora]|uniref:SAM-dependent methyltransferase n=1 Tax=Saccharothrix longispora TaxID=33920 RepID=A0ABU1PXT8_9PSEU|nr:class I SAM-dependent methyltransferase [Saccharothrix longispora]MDR6595266.1 SAM-dependent methyltransferase [Saccharothrix longispora]
MTIREALDALAAGDLARAREAVREPASPLAAALATHLDGAAGGSVYDRPAAFEAFVRGGGNVALYEAVVDALGALYERVRPVTLLDVGCGDGRALRPALDRPHAPTGVTVVEPSRALLDALRLPGATAFPGRVQDFLATTATGYDVVQSTFALHAVPHGERDGVLADLVARAGVLALVEFDVPDVPHAGPGHRAFLAETYERGLAEYGEDRDLVAQGFLMPVLTGQLVPGAVRSTWEQPAARWAEQVARAGFGDVVVTPLHDYWSSPAFLLTATGSAGA